MKYLNKVLKDHDVLLLIQLLLMIILSGYVFSLYRFYLSVSLGIIIPLVFIFLLNIIFKNKNNNELLRFILISLYVSLGVVVFVKNWNSYYYTITNSIIIIFYYIIKKLSIPLVFNPLSWAIVISLFLFPFSSFHFRIGFFTFTTIPFILTLLLTLGIIFNSKSWPVVASYFSCITLWSLVNWIILKDGFGIWFAPEFGFNGLAFMSLILINDIQFKSMKGMLFFGLSVAVLKIILKYNEYFYPDYLSIFIVSTLINVFFYFRKLFFNKRSLAS